MGYSQYDPPMQSRSPWNAGRNVGTKRPLTQKQIWAIRFFLDREQRLRDRALFDLAIDSKIRGCDLVKIKIGDVVAGPDIRTRAIVAQQKTGRPVQASDVHQRCGAKSGRKSRASGQDGGMVGLGPPAGRPVGSAADGFSVDTRHLRGRIATNRAVGGIKRDSGSTVLCPTRAPPTRSAGPRVGVKAVLPLLRSRTRCFLALQEPLTLDVRPPLLRNLRLFQRSGPPGVSVHHPSVRTENAGAILRLFISAAYFRMRAR